MPRLRPVAAAILLGAMVALPAAHAADTYPSRPVKIIVPFGAGGPTDLFTRAVAEELGKALHEPFRTITLFNPVVHLVSGFRWSFYSVADVPVWSSVAVTVAIIAICMAVIAWMFRSGYRLKQ